jgi:serine/threonine-protein kinase
MGVVHEAVREADGQRVALKVVAPDTQDESFAARFEREVAIAASLHHLNIIPIVDASPARDDVPAYLAMQFVEGTDLDALIVDRGHLAPEEVGDVVGAVGAALDCAHAAGLVHRDVKPANVMIAADGTPYLGDFGLTRHLSSTRMTATGMLIGTVDYASPEQIQGQPVDARADVYALAALAFRALTGQVPFPRENDMAKLWAHVNDPRPELPSRLDAPTAALSGAIARGMAVDPAQRPQSAGDLARALDAATQGRTVPIFIGSVATGDAAPVATVPAPAGRPPHAARPATAPQPRQRRVWPLVTAAAVVVLLAAGTATALSLLRGDDRAAVSEAADAPAPDREPVKLTIDDTPTTVEGDAATISGRTTPGARVEVAGQAATVDGDRFEHRVAIEVGENRIRVVATKAGLEIARDDITVRRAQPEAQAPIEEPAPEPAPVEPQPGPAESASFEQCSFTPPGGSGPAGVQLVEQRNASCEQARDVATKQFYEGEPDPDGWECGDPESIGVEQARVVCTKNGPNGRQVIAIELGA